MTLRNILVSWRRFVPVALIALAILAALSPQSTGAHATFDRSDPQPNTVLASSPAEIRIWFTEPLEQVYSDIRIFDQTGHEIPNIEAKPGEGDESLVAALPEPLENGTYSVVWKNLSAADGHQAQGYFTFTIGTAADIASIAVPVLPDSGGAPISVQALSRWFVLVSLAVAIAIWPVWLLVLWPSTRKDAGLARELSARVATLGVRAVVVAILANVFALIVQATLLDQGSLPSRIGDTLFDTRFGRLWLARIGILLLMGIGIRLAPWLDPLGKRVTTIALLVIAALLPLPVSMNSHASALDSGRITAIAFDYVHLLTASLWFGGLLMLAGVLLRSLRVQVVRRVVLAQALPRFSAMALVCWGLLLVTGIYSWWLHVGSWDALRHTQYGQSLLAKLILIGIILLIAATNLLLITRKLAQTDPKTNPRWFGRLGYAVVAELVLTLLILLAVGRMTSLQPGRDVLAAERASETFQYDLSGHDATLALTPGAAGPNHFTLTLAGDPVPDGSEALLRLTFDGEDLGTKEIALYRSSGTTFESHGSELSIAGEWDIELLVRNIGDFEWTDTQTIALGARGSTVGQPPWRFDTGGLIGLLLITMALIGFVFAWRAGKDRLRKESAGLAVTATVLGILLMVQGRTQPVTGYDPGLVNSVAATSDSVTRGEGMFQTICASCHGVEGLGDGPESGNMFPKPANFTAPHTKAHPDGQFFDWIQNGKPGTSMPAFSTLTDDKIWDLINYIQVEFQGKPEVEASPQASPAPAGS